MPYSAPSSSEFENKGKQVQKNAKRDLKVMMSLSYEKRLKELSLAKLRQIAEKIAVYGYVHLVSIGYVPKMIGLYGKSLKFKRNYLSFSSQRVG